MNDYQMPINAAKIMMEHEELCAFCTPESQCFTYRLAAELAAAQGSLRDLASYLPECTCAMSEASMNSCKVHGPDGSDLIYDLWHYVNDPYNASAPRAALAGEDS